MKVMIVEDSEPMRKLIKTFLAKVVDQFVECYDGDEALKKYTKHKPDLVLMDLEMRKMGGLDATRAIKDAFSEAHVLVVSQWDSADLRAAAKFAGAEGYINKADLFPLIEMIQAITNPSGQAGRKQF